jgi:hypothetical protein
LVVAVGVEGELVEEFAVFGQDSDLEVADQDEDVFAGVAAADADVVQAAVVAEADGAVGVDGPGSAGR